MALRTEHTCDRCHEPAPKGMRVERAMWDDAFPGLTPVVLTARDLCERCAEELDRWLGVGEPGWYIVPEALGAQCVRTVDEMVGKALRDRGTPANVGIEPTGQATEAQRDALTCGHCGHRTFNLHQPWCTDCGRSLMVSRGD